MKLRYAAAALVINFCAGALVTLSHAEEKKEVESDGKPPVVKRAEPGILREARGRIKDIDKDKNQVVLTEERKGPVTLKVDKTTTIFIDGRIGALNDISPGGEVRASYEFRQGANRAQWIEVSKKPTTVSKERLPEAPGMPEQVSDPGSPH